MESGDEAVAGPSCSGSPSRRRRSTRLKVPKYPEAESPEDKYDYTTRWTLDEKKAFLRGLEEHGNYNINPISDLVGRNKSKEQIEAKIKFLKESTSPIVATDSVKDLDRLERWFNGLKSIQSGPCAPDVIPRLLRLIPLLEDMPDPEVTGIDFKEAYNALADLIEGKPSEVSATTSALFASTVKEAYNILAHQGGVSNELRLGALKKWLKEGVCDPMETDQPMESNMRLTPPNCFVSSPEVNPLNVPPSFLTANAVYDLSNLPFARILMNDWRPPLFNDNPNNEDDVDE